jgi:hypothetical protein
MAEGIVCSAVLVIQKLVGIKKKIAPKIAAHTNAKMPNQL